MSLTQLESFVAVAEEQHVGRAARRLHVTQPPLTRRIRSLELELGVELFARTTRGMRLLPPGEVLLEHAREILHRIDIARDHVTAAATSPPPDERYRVNTST
jgi:DNA-binding transcriptional LysR family regulator